MNKERIDDLVDILASQYAKVENTLVIRTQQELMKYLENPEQWEAMQTATQRKFRNAVVGISRDELSSLNSKCEKAVLLTYKEVDKDAIEITEREIVAHNVPASVKEQIAAIKQWNAEQVARLANAAVEAKRTTVRILAQTAKPDELYEAVKRQVPRGIENGIKITYSNGRSVQWRSYMEMNIRTTINTEASQEQVAAGARMGIVFYACDEFADCAPDHADYQGKIYYNEEAEIDDETMAYIEANGIQSMQEVMNGEPWLTTRPNCRHNFHAVSTEEVMSKSASKVVEDNGYKFGEYDDKNYRDLQKQRYNERQIRKYKLRAEGARKINGETGTRMMSDQRNAADAKVREWQAKQRELIRSNPNLERVYARENAKVMAEDLGVKYDYKLVDGELKKK